MRPGQHLLLRRQRLSLSEQHRLRYQQVNPIRLQKPLRPRVSTLTLAVHQSPTGAIQGHRRVEQGLWEVIRDR